MRFKVAFAMLCLVTALSCQRKSARPDGTCGRAGPMVLQRAATAPHGGWLPVTHVGQRWYLDPEPLLCAMHIVRITIGMSEFDGYEATLMFTAEGRRRLAQATRAPGGYIATSVFGQVHSIAEVVTPIDGDQLSILVNEAQLPVFERVVKAIERR